MNTKLLVNLKVYREKFIMEDYCGTNNILGLVSEGSFSFEAPEGKYIVKPYEGALFRHNVLYHREVIEPVTMYLFRYTSDMPIFASDYITFANSSRIKSTVEMLDKLDNGMFKNEFEYRKNLFADIITQYMIENSALVGTKSDAPIEAAIAFLNANMHKKINPAEAAAQTNLSYVQFLRRFKSHTGMTPSDYITTLRIQKAKNMLADTDMFIKDIASLCGFENEYYFSNFFKKHIGVSPLAYRKTIM